MAFLIAAGIRYTIQGVQSGIQAHKDYQSDQAVQVSLDRYGQPKARSPVYGLVMKAEQKLNKDKPKDKGAVGNSCASTSIRTRQEASESSAEFGHGQAIHEVDRAGAAPPSYEAAVGTSMRDNIGEAGLAYDDTRASLPRASATTQPRFAPAPTGSDDKQDPQDKVVRRSTGSSASSGSSSSSNSDSELHSESRNTKHNNQESTKGSTRHCGCRARKLERRVKRAERGLERKTNKLEKKGERASDQDLRKVRKAEWKLEEAQRKLGKLGL